jgi:hypothetical protein
MRALLVLLRPQSLEQEDEERVAVLTHDPARLAFVPSDRLLHAFPSFATANASRYAGSWLSQR